MARKGPRQTLSTSICGTADLTDIVAVYNFNSPTYKSSPESLPVGVKSYLAGLLVGRLNTCAALAGQAAAKSACTPNPGERDPRALWQQLKFCEGILGLEPQAAASCRNARADVLRALIDWSRAGWPSSGHDKIWRCNERWRRWRWRQRRLRACDG